MLQKVREFRSPRETADEAAKRFDFARLITFQPCYTSGSLDSAATVTGFNPPSLILRTGRTGTPTPSPENKQHKS